MHQHHQTTSKTIKAKQASVSFTVPPKEFEETSHELDVKGAVNGVVDGGDLLCDSKLAPLLQPATSQAQNNTDTDDNCAETTVAADQPLTIFKNTYEKSRKLINRPHRGLAKGSPAGRTATDSSTLTKTTRDQSTRVDNSHIDCNTTYGTVNGSVIFQTSGQQQ